MTERMKSTRIMGDNEGTSISESYLRDVGILKELLSLPDAASTGGKAYQRFPQDMKIDITELHHTFSLQVRKLVSGAVSRQSVAKTKDSKRREVPSSPPDMAKGKTEMKKRINPTHIPVASLRAAQGGVGAPTQRKSAFQEKARVSEGGLEKPTLEEEKRLLSRRHKGKENTSEKEKKVSSGTKSSSEETSETDVIGPRSDPSEIGALFAKLLKVHRSEYLLTETKFLFHTSMVPLGRAEHAEENIKGEGRWSRAESVSFALSALCNLENVLYSLGEKFVRGILNYWKMANLEGLEDGLLKQVASFRDVGERVLSRISNQRKALLYSEAVEEDTGDLLQTIDFVDTNLTKAESDSNEIVRERERIREQFYHTFRFYVYSDGRGGGSDTFNMESASPEKATVDNLLNFARDGIDFLVSLLESEMMKACNPLAASPSGRITQSTQMSQRMHKLVGRLGMAPPGRPLVFLEGLVEKADSHLFLTRLARRMFKRALITLCARSALVGGGAAADLKLAEFVLLLRFYGRILASIAFRTAHEPEAGSFIDHASPYTVSAVIEGGLRTDFAQGLSEEVLREVVEHASPSTVLLRRNGELPLVTFLLLPFVVSYTSVASQRGFEIGKPELAFKPFLWAIRGLPFLNAGDKHFCGLSLFLLSEFESIGDDSLESESRKNEIEVSPFLLDNYSELCTDRFFSVCCPTVFDISRTVSNESRERRMTGFMPFSKRITPISVQPGELTGDDSLVATSRQLEQSFLRSNPQMKSVIEFVTNCVVRNAYNYFIERSDKLMMSEEEVVDSIERYCSQHVQKSLTSLVPLDEGGKSVELAIRIALNNSRNLAVSKAVSHLQALRLRSVAVEDKVKDKVSNKHFGTKVDLRSNVFRGLAVDSRASFRIPALNEPPEIVELRKTDQKMRDALRVGDIPSYRVSLGMLKKSLEKHISKELFLNSESFRSAFHTIIDATIVFLLMLRDADPVRKAPLIISALEGHLDVLAAVSESVSRHIGRKFGVYLADKVLSAYLSYTGESPVKLKENNFVIQDGVPANLASFFICLWRRNLVTLYELDAVLEDNWDSAIEVSVGIHLKEVLDKFTSSATAVGDIEEEK